MHDFAAVEMALPGVVVGLGVWLRDWHPPLSRSPVPWLASQLEEQAFTILVQKYAPDRYVISAHMLLIDVIGRDRTASLTPEETRFAWKAHCDFVIVDWATLTTERVVEVNGPRHHTELQEHRDRIKQRILRQRGIACETWQPKDKMAPGTSF